MAHGPSPTGPAARAASRNRGARPGRHTVRSQEAAAAGERPFPLCGDPPARPGRVLHFESLPGAGSGHLSAHATGAGGRAGWVPGARHGLLVPLGGRCLPAMCAGRAPPPSPANPTPPPKKTCRDAGHPRLNYLDGKHGRCLLRKPKWPEALGYQARPGGRAGLARGGHGAPTRPQLRHEASGRSGKKRRPRTLPPTHGPKFGGTEERTGAPGHGGGAGTRGRGPLPEARPAEATPGTHLCSGGKPVAKKNVRQDYGTYIRLCPHPRGTGRSQHTTDFPSSPRATAAPRPRERRPFPPPAVRGPWARCARPLRSTRRLAHAPPDPGNDEREGRGAGTRRAWSLGWWDFADGPWRFPRPRRVPLLYELLPAAAGGDGTARRRWGGDARDRPSAVPG